jgi:hypothetical protein
MATPTDDAPRSELVSALPWVIGAVLVMGILSGVWWALLEPANDKGIEQLVIPEGTAQKIADGEPVFVASEILIQRAGELRIVNRDTTAHTISGQTIAPGETVDVIATEQEGEFVCSFHPGGSLGFTVSGRGSLMLTVAVPMFGLGIPIGLGIALAASIGRRLNYGEGSPA